MKQNQRNVVTRETSEAATRPGRVAVLLVMAGLVVGVLWMAFHVVGGLLAGLAHPATQYVWIQAGFVVVVATLLLMHAVRILIALGHDLKGAKA